MRTLTLKNAIWPKSAAHGLKRGSSTIFMEGALFSRFDENFQAKVTISSALTLKNAIWPKRAAHDLKSGFCKIFLESALFFCFEEMRMT